MSRWEKKGLVVTILPKDQRRRIRQAVRDQQSTAVDDSVSQVLG